MSSLLFHALCKYPGTVRDHLEECSISLHFRELYNFLRHGRMSALQNALFLSPFSIWGFFSARKKEIPLWKFLSVGRPGGTKQMDDNNGLIWVSAAARRLLRLLPI